MLAHVYDEAFKVIGRERKKTKGYEGTAAGLKRMVKVVSEALDAAGIKKTELAGIGIGSPGPLDLNKGTIIQTANLGWVNAPLKETLEKAFSCPVVVLNDVDAGVYGEYVFGAGKGARCLIGIFPGTGIGGGCVYEGLLIRGQTQSVMEVGHMQVMPKGPLCGCGQRGCLEALASRLAISAAAAQACYRGEAPHLMELAGSDLNNIRSGTLKESIEAGDTVIEIILRRAARWIGVGVANLINLMGPDRIVLGGGLVEAMPELFCEEVLKSARKNTMLSFVDTFTVNAAKLGDDATVLGAAAWARKNSKEVT